MAGPSPDARRVLTHGAIGAVLVLVLGACSALAGSPTSTSGWRSDTDQALGAVLSSLGTSRVLLEQRERGHLGSPYVRVGLRDALTTAEKETAAYRALQPPAAERDRHREVVGAIDEAITVLSAAAVAGSGPPGAARTEALRAVRDRYDTIDRLRTEVTAP